MYLCVLCGSRNKQRLFHYSETECVYCAVSFNIIRLILAFRQGLLHLFLPISQLSPLVAAHSVPREGYCSGKRCQGDESHVLTDNNWVATSCSSMHLGIRQHTTFVVLLSCQHDVPNKDSLPPSTSSPIHISLTIASDTDSTVK